MSKFWCAESLSSQLHDMNKQLFSEIDNLQLSLMKISQNQSQDNSSSTANLAALNPFLSHLSHLRSLYEQKLTQSKGTMSQLSLDPST